MRKQVVNSVAVVLGLISIGGSCQQVLAAENSADQYVSEKMLSNEHVKADKPTTKTLTIAADGSLTGRMVPYVQSIPNTGKVDLHYVGVGKGFSDFDETTLFIKLPDEFKYVAAHAGFVHAISGHLYAQGYTHKITSEDIQVFDDRLVISMGKRFYVGVGSYKADLEINYGKILKKDPNVRIPNAENELGYFFSSNLAFDVAPWDLINFPIIGDFSGDLYADEAQAIQ